jgi:hypothetical protein
MELNEFGVLIVHVYAPAAEIPFKTDDVNVVPPGAFIVNDKFAVPSLSAAYSVFHPMPTSTTVDDVTNVYGAAPALGVIDGVNSDPDPGVKSSHAKYCRSGSFHKLCRVRDGVFPGRANGPRFVEVSDPLRIAFNTVDTAFVAAT